jgi:hypothetical protein
MNPLKAYYKDEKEEWHEITILQFVTLTEGDLDDTWSWVSAVALLTDGTITVIELKNMTTNYDDTQE